MKKALWIILALVLLIGAAASAEEAVLRYSSFDGGGPEYSVEIEDPEIVSFRREYEYGNPDHELLDGSPYDVILTFTGLKAGSTRIMVSARSPITESFDEYFIADVDEELNVAIRPDRRLTDFFFTRGGYMPGVTHEVILLGDTYYLYITGHVFREVSPEDMDRLTEMLAENDIASWDGFHGEDSMVLDGEGFTLRMNYSDGTEIYASGENSFPDRYHAVAEGLEEILDPLAGLPEDTVAGTYKYEGEGFGGDFTLTLSPDGTYSYYEGFLSSYIGQGRWSVEGGRLYMSEDGGYDLYFMMIPVENALVFLEERSDNFIYVEVPDLGRFEKTE